MWVHNLLSSANIFSEAMCYKSGTADGEVNFIQLFGCSIIMAYKIVVLTEMRFVSQVFRRKALNSTVKFF